MINALRYNRDIAVMESFVSTNIAGLLRDIFPSILKDFTGFTDRFEAVTPAITMSPKQREFLGEVSKHNYMDIAALAAFVPEGLNCTYAQYGTVLVDATLHASRVLHDVLAPYSLFLAQLISTREHKFSAASTEKFYSDLESIRAMHNKSLGACFAKGSTRTELTVERVVDRNSEWPTAFSLANNCVDNVNAVDRKMVAKKVKECSTLLDVVMKKIGRNEFVGISPEVLNSLANGAFQVASELEFYAAIHYKASAFAETIGRTIEHFQNVFDKKIK